MDKAFWDTMRWDNFRWDTFDPVWDNKILPKFKSVSAKSAGGVDPSVAGAGHAGKVRAGVYVPLFDKVLKKFKETG